MMRYQGAFHAFAIGPSESRDAPSAILERGGEYRGNWPRFHLERFGRWTRGFAVLFRGVRGCRGAFAEAELAGWLMTGSTRRVSRILEGRQSRAGCRLSESSRGRSLANLREQCPAACASFASG